MTSEQANYDTYVSVNSSQSQQRIKSWFNISYLKKNNNLYIK